jgi:hypothetical protein
LELDDFSSFASFASSVEMSLWIDCASVGSFVLASSAFLLAISCLMLAASSDDDDEEEEEDELVVKSDVVELETASTMRHSFW